jgi:hypothetical protein
MAMVMAKAKFSPKEMAVLARAAAAQGMGAAENASRMAKDPKFAQKLKRKIS